MCYDEYLTHGLPIGPGRAEAAYKTGVGRRLKGTGIAGPRTRREPRAVRALRPAERLVSTTTEMNAFRRPRDG